MDATVPAEISKAMAAGSATPPTLTPDELNAWKQLDLFYKKGLGLRERDVAPAAVAAPKSWAERAYPKLLYYNKVEKGGHFAAWEQPELFVREQRAAVKQ